MILLRLPGTYPAQGDTHLPARTLRRRGLPEGARVRVPAVVPTLATELHRVDDAA